VYSVLYLVITFFCVACHYLLLNAQFLAAVHIIVYAGAIMVLFLYVIMLLNLNTDEVIRKKAILRVIGVITACLLMVVIVGAIRGVDMGIISFDSSNNTGLVKNLGKLLFNEYLLPFEVVSILLLTAMVGAVMLGKSHMKRIKESSRQEKNGKTVHSSAAKVEPVNEITK